MQNLSKYCQFLPMPNISKSYQISPDPVKPYRRTPMRLEIRPMVRLVESCAIAGNPAMSRRIFLGPAQHRHIRPESRKDPQIPPRRAISFQIAPDMCASFQISPNLGESCIIPPNIRTVADSVKSWLILTKYCRSLPNVANYGQIFPNLGTSLRISRIGPNLDKYRQIYSDVVKSSEILANHPK